MPRTPLHVGRPNIGDKAALLARIETILETRWLSNDGPLVREFEERVASIAGVRHCVAMCNATVALEIAARALGMSGEVIVPSYTFIATAHALEWAGLTPVFADIDAETHNIDPESIEQMVTPRTTGIVGVHLWGRPCDTDAIGAVARAHELDVIYDAAHAFGCSHGGRPIGSFGACEVFSFHATKFINCFEGGAVVTNDDEVARRMRLMRNFGFEGYDNVVHLGTNGKMSEVAAAMGLTSLEALDAIVEVNRRNHMAYRDELAGARGVSLLEFDETQSNNYQYVVIELDSDEAGISRDALVACLHANGIIARRYFWPGCHRMEPYRTRNPSASESLPDTTLVAERVIVLPTGQAVGVGDVKEIAGIIRGAVS